MCLLCEASDLIRINGFPFYSICSVSLILFNSDMYKNQLQELAQRSCFNLPSYSCIREGPDHAPRFKATVNFNGEAFESSMFYSTLRQAEHAAAEVALNKLACRGPSRVLASRVLDETGVYKNLLQETAHRAGLKLPAYTTVRSGPGHVPSFICTVELAGMSFSGEPARTKKQAQKNAAMAAWSALKRLVQRGTQRSAKSNEEQEQVTIAHFLTSILSSELRNKQLDGQQIQDRYFPVCQDLSTPTSSFYATQYQSWVYPYFSHEMAPCQMWQHEHLLQLQQCLFSLQVPPPPVPSPQSLPHVHAALSPNSYSFVPVKAEPSPTGPELAITTSRPSLCFSDQIIGDPIMEKSTVSITEIHEGKPERLSAILPSIGSDSKLLAHVDAEARLKEVVSDVEQQKNAERESKTESAPRYKSVDSQVQNPCDYDASSSHRQSPPHPTSSFPRSFRPSSVACPVMIRPVRPAPPSSARPVLPMGAVLSSSRRLDSAAARIHVPPRLRTGVSSQPAASCSPIKMNVGSMQPHYLAPAVRIRSVVPVCAAPPARKTSIPCQEPVLLPKDEVDVVDVPSQTTPPSS